MPRFNICEPCWQQRYPRPLTFSMKFADASEDVCHYCGKKNTDGIYVREDNKGGSSEPPLSAA